MHPALAFIGGGLGTADQEAAQKAIVRKHAEHFVEGGNDFHQCWRSKHTAVFLRSAPGGETHHYFAYRLVAVQGQEFRDGLITETPDLDAAITAAARAEGIA